MIHLHKTPRLLKQLYPEITWSRKSSSIHLTFDDGPQPQVTEWVLDQLGKYHAKATFFSVGENIYKYKNLYQKTIDLGHTVGNHTFNHYNGWKVSDDEYVNNVEKCEQLMVSKNILFRPPYGRIKRSQIECLKKKYEIIMWSHLAWDFDKSMVANKAIDALSNAEKGSILVFHDSLKCFENLKKILPSILKNLSSRGLKMDSL